MQSIPTLPSRGLPIQSQKDKASKQPANKIDYIERPASEIVAPEHPVTVPFDPDVARKAIEELDDNDELAYTYHCTTLIASGVRDTKTASGVVSALFTIIASHMDEQQLKPFSQVQKDTVKQVATKQDGQGYAKIMAQLAGFVKGLPPSGKKVVDLSSKGDDSSVQYEN